MISLFFLSFSYFSNTLAGIYSSSCWNKMQSQEQAKELKQTIVYESVITINSNDLQKMTISELEKYMGYPFKISCKPNYYRGLRRSIAVSPFKKQEFWPDPEKFYILDKQNRNFIYPRGLNAKYANDFELYRYWFINTITSGIVYFQYDINRYNIDFIQIYKYITPELEAILDEHQTTTLESIRKTLLDKYWHSLESLPDELIELVINYIPIDSSEVFQKQDTSKQENGYLSKRVRY